MSINVNDLPNTVEELKSLIVEMDERHRSRIDSLEEQLRILKKELFGSKSEKRSSQETELRQLHLFDEAEVFAEDDEAEEEPQPVAPHTRRKPKRKPLPAALPRVEVIHDLPEAEKVCSCGAPLCRIGEEVSEKLDMIPAKVEVIRHVRIKYACKACEGIESDEPAVKIAPPPPQIIPKGIATPGLLAHVAVSKYADALPLYRQSQIFTRNGIDLPRSTLASWMIKAADACDPLMALLREDLLSGPLINIDETPVQVLKEPGRSNTTDSYMWVFRGGDPQKPVVVFHYSPTRSGEVPRALLEGYKGFCQTDAFSGYNGLERPDSGIVLVGCFAHVRRYFVKVIDARGKNAGKKRGSAEVALDYIGKLYRIENHVRAKELSPAEMWALRRELAQPVLSEFKAWLDKRVNHSPPQGLLGKAFNYALSHWPKLIRYLDDVHITPDNNAAENAIRPFVVGRKNWLFAGSPNGARAGSTLYSLIETAKACGLEPYHYLRFTFEKLPYAKTEADYRGLLPQAVSAEQLASPVSNG